MVASVAAATTCAVLTTLAALSAATLLGALRRFWWLVFGLGVVGFLAGFLPAPATSADAQTITYQAQRTLLVSSETGNLYSDPVAVAQIQLLARKGEVPKRAAEELGISEGEGRALGESLSVTLDQASGELLISLTQFQPGRAADIVDTFSEELKTYVPERADTLREQRQELALARIETLEDEIETLQDQLEASPADRLIAARLDARTRQYTLVYETYDNLSAERSDLSILDLDTAASESEIVTGGGGLAAPRSRAMRGAFGALFGVGVGWLIANLLMRYDRKVRTFEQVEDMLGLPVAVRIPVLSGPLAPIVVLPDRHDQLSDAYRTLRSVLLVTGGERESESRRSPITAVLSACPGDGKTSVAANLAAAFAESGRRTVAVNTDFRRPALNSRLGAQPPTRAADQPGVIGSVATANLLTRTEVPGVALLDLAGHSGSPGDLARGTARRLDGLSTLSDSIVVDTSPVGATAEVLEVLPHVEVVVLVCRLGHTLGASAAQSVATIRAITNIPIIVVAFGDTAQRSNYYEYGLRPAPSRATASVS
jgi:Mrp family chromosome partitioning ATPase